MVSKDKRKEKHADGMVPRTAGLVDWKCVME